MGIFSAACASGEAEIVRILLTKKNIEFSKTDDKGVSKIKNKIQKNDLIKKFYRIMPSLGPVKLEWSIL